jgi:CHASE3 domain sensor protein
MSKFEQHQIAWSAEDQATYAKWRRWMLIAYGSVMVVGTVVVLARFG